jgi:type I restriction enzyme S subunit
MRVKFGSVAVESRETYKGSQSGFPIVGLEHFTPEDVNITEWNVNTENTFNKMFRKGQVLFGRRGTYLKKAAVAPCDGIYSGDITVIAAKEDALTPELLPFIIQNDRFFDFAVEKSSGSLSPRAKWEHLREFEIELPLIDEQRLLAEVLWAFDETRQTYKREIKLTDELVKSQFAEMFGDGCFEIKRLEEVVKVRSSKRVYQKEQTDCGVPFLRVSDLTDRITSGTSITELFISDDLYENLARSGLTPTAGDILGTSRGTLGLCTSFENQIDSISKTE